MKISKGLLNNLFKQEQLRLPLEGEPAPEIKQNPIKRRAKKKSPVDRRIMEARSVTKVHEILNERNKPLTGRELYAYLTSGSFDHHQRSRDARRLFDDEDAEKNIPKESTQTALDFANDLIKRPDINPTKKEQAEKIINTLLNHSKLPSDTYSKILSSKENPYAKKESIERNDGVKVDTYSDDRIRSVINNPHIEETHLLTAAENHPEYIDNLLYRDDVLKNERVLNHIISKDHIFNEIPSHRLGSIAKWHNENLHPNNAKKIIDHPFFDENVTNHETIDSLLEKLPPEQRESYINKKLGIEGGSLHDPEKESGDDNWDNWLIGADHGNQAAKLLLRSKYLNDSHAEHIKRHGDFQQKYDMYHKNSHIDPRHGIEMFNKWKNDDDHHGYSAEELNEANTENFDKVYTHEDLPEDVKESIIEEGLDSGSIDEYADQSYNYDEFLNDLDDDRVLKIMGTEYDDDDEIEGKLREEYHWNDLNPNANTSHPHYDAIEKFLDHNKYDTDLETFQNETGLHPNDVDIPYDEESDTVDIDHVRNHFNENLGGPREIDYSDHEDFTINDHPDFEDRYEQEAKDWRLSHWADNMYDIADSKYLYEEHRESPEYEEAFGEAKKSYLEENSGGHVAELYGNSHEEPEFIPEHLHPHMPELEQFKEQKKKKIRDGGQYLFLNKQIKDRDYEHEYGENLHHYELAKEYADARGGNIDASTMYKIAPNQKEVWKNMFGDKGKLSSDEIMQKIGEIPKTKYDISFGKWDANKMQNTNNQDEIIFKLDHSEDSLKEIKKDPELYKTFKTVQELSKRSGHPTNDNTIAWARVDFTDPKNPMVSELQSDYGTAVRNYLKDNNHEDRANHINQIQKLHSNWRENLLNFVIKTAKKHEAEKVFTHSPESKANQTGSKIIHSVYNDSYKKVPRNMGFKPISHTEMPLTKYGMENFIARESESPESRSEKHMDAMKHHLSIANKIDEHIMPDLSTIDMSAPKNLTEQNYESLKLKGYSDKHKEEANKHLGDYNKHIGSFGQEHIDLHSLGDLKLDDHAFKEVLDKEGFVNHPHDSLVGASLESTKPLQGHVFDLTPKTIKKHIDLATTLIKAELMLVKNFNSKKDINKDIININLIKEMLGYEIR